jgi:hypothetical protein
MRDESTAMNSDSKAIDRTFTQLFGRSPMYDSVEIVYSMPLVDFDDDEGCIEVGCLACREDVQATYGPSGKSRRMYAACFDCDECGTELVTFDAFTRRAL